MKIKLMLLPQSTYSSVMSHSQVWANVKVAGNFFSHCHTFSEDSGSRFGLLRTGVFMAPLSTILLVWTLDGHNSRESPFTPRQLTFYILCLHVFLQIAIDYPSLLHCHCFASLPFCMDFDLDFEGNAGTT